MILSDTLQEITCYFAFNGTAKSFPLLPDEVLRINIPSIRRLTGTYWDQKREPSVTYIYAGEVISVYASNAAPDTSDGFLVLPEQSDGSTDFIIPAWPTTSHSSMMSVVGHHDDTQVIK